MPRRPKEPASQDRVFADRLNHLFATRLTPSGKPYSLQAVSDGTKGAISPTYLNDLRKGRVAVPGVDKIAALAAFFGVDLGYFLGQESVRPPEPPPGVDDELMRALNNPLVREIATSTGSFGPEEWREMLTILRAQVRLQRLTEERIRREVAAETQAPPPRDIRTAPPRRRRTPPAAPATDGPSMEDAPTQAGAGPAGARPEGESR